MSYLEDGKGQQSQSSPAETPLAKTVLWLHITLGSCFTRLCVVFSVKAAFNENQCGTRQAALNKETQLPGKKVLEALDSPQQEFLKVPGLRKQQAKQEKRDAKMLLGQNMGDT